MKPSTPTFHHALVQQLVDASFVGKERQLLMRGTAMLPTTKEQLGLAEKMLGLVKEDLQRIQQQARDYETVITLAKVIFQLTDNAEGEGLVDWHGQ